MRWIHAQAGRLTGLVLTGALMVGTAGCDDDNCGCPFSDHPPATSVSQPTSDAASSARDPDRSDGRPGRDLASADSTSVDITTGAVSEGADWGPPPTEGEPRFSINQETLAFEDDVALGTTQTRSLQLTAMGREDVTIEGYDIAGEGFAIEPVNADFPLTMTHGQSVELAVTFAPEEAREYFAEVTFRGSSELGRHQVVLWGNLSCVNYVAGPTLGREDGPMQVGERREFSLILENCSTIVPFDVLSVDVHTRGLRDHPDPTDWFTTPPPIDEPERVEPGAEWSYTVAFEPEAPGDYAMELAVWLDQTNRAGGWGRPLPGENRQMGARIVPQVVEAE